MMPVAGTNEQTETVDYKKKYKALKRKLRFLVYEHESFLEELKKSQRKLLKVSRDRSFLLDRLIQYEKVDDSSSDSDATASSDSEGDAPREAGSTKKRKLSGSATTATPPALPQFKQEATSLLATMAIANLPKPPTAPQTAQVISPKGSGDPPKKRQKVTKKATKSGATSTGRPTVAQALEQQEQQLRQQLQQQQQQQQQQHQQQQLQQQIPVSLAETLQPGHMTREELERHLEYKQSTKPQFMSIDKAPNMLPDDIFNDENSNSDSMPTVGGLPKLLIKR